MENQRHPITRWTLDQSAGRVRLPELFGLSDNLVEQIAQSTLLVDEPRRVAHDVHEQDVAYLELGLFLDLGSHLVTEPNLPRIVSFGLSSVESKARGGRWIRSTRCR